MKQNNIKLIFFIIPVSFLLLGLAYRDIFYGLISIISFLIVLALFVPKKHAAISFKLPKIKLSKVQIKKFSLWKTSSQKKQSANIAVRNELLNKWVFGFLFLAAVVFTAITIFFLPDTKTANFFLSYYAAYLQLAKQYSMPLIVTALAFVITGIVYGLKQYNKYIPRVFLKKVGITLAAYVIALLLSFHLAFGIAYAFAAGHVSYLVISHNTDVGRGAILSDTQAIKKALESSKTVPQIVSYDFSYKKSLVLLKLNNDERFYGKRLTVNLPGALYEQISIAQAPMYMLGNTLLIVDLKQDTLEKFSPALGELLVKATFKDKNIKENPEIKILNRQAYLKIREEQINEEVKKLDESIAKLDSEIGTVYSYVTEGRKQLQEAKDFLANSESQKQSAYNECKTAGEVYEGQFYRYYTDDACNAFLAEWGTIVSQVSADVTEIQSTLNHNQRVLADYQAARGYVLEAREFIDSTKDTTPHELGVFLPEKEIKIALDSDNPNDANTYLSTLSHEYLHYSSYISEERVLDRFFEEALTEYFARKIMKEQLGYSENVGYPVAVKIIEEMTKKVSEEELLAIYFTKDQKRLEYVLNEAYGKNFYTDSSYFFSLVNYLPLDESLDAANTIMVRIEGKKISKASVL